MSHYSDPGLEAELAYRRERAVQAGLGTRAPRSRWLRLRRRTR